MSSEPEEDARPQYGLTGPAQELQDLLDSLHSPVLPGPLPSVGDDSAETTAAAAAAAAPAQEDYAIVDSSADAAAHAQPTPPPSVVGSVAEARTPNIDVNHVISLMRGASLGKHPSASPRRTASSNASSPRPAASPSLQPPSSPVVGLAGLNIVNAGLHGSEVLCPNGSIYRILSQKAEGSFSSVYEAVTVVPPVGGRDPLSPGDPVAIKIVKKSSNPLQLAEQRQEPVFLIRLAGASNGIADDIGRRSSTVATSHRSRNPSMDSSLRRPSLVSPSPVPGLSFDAMEGSSSRASFDVSASAAALLSPNSPQVQEDRISVHSGASSESRRRLKREPRLWGVVTLYEYFETDKELIMVLEYCDTGTKQGLPHPLARVIFTRVANSIEFCHRHGIFHRDLKPENILVRTNPNDPNNYFIRLCDFGLATDRASLPPGACGALRYMPPECLPSEASVPESTTKSNPKRSYYSPESADIWALTITLLNCLFASHPWTSPQDPRCVAYLSYHDPTYFVRNFNVSRSFDAILRRVFDRDFRRRTLNVGGVKGLRDLILGIPAFVEAPELASVVVSDDDDSGGGSSGEEDLGSAFAGLDKWSTGVGVPGSLKGVSTTTTRRPVITSTASSTSSSNGAVYFHPPQPSLQSPRIDQQVHQPLVVTPIMSGFGPRTSSANHLVKHQHQQQQQQQHQHHYQQLPQQQLYQQRQQLQQKHQQQLYYQQHPTHQVQPIQHQPIQHLPIQHQPIQHQPIQHQPIHIVHQGVGFSQAVPHSVQTMPHNVYASAQHTFHPSQQWDSANSPPYR